MNSVFKDLVAKDKRVKKDIMPLSQIDAEIIEEIMYALKNLGQDLLLIILNKYKTIPDSQFLHLIKQYNVDYENINLGEGEGESIEKPKYIDLKGNILQISLIQSITRDEIFNYSTTQMQYRVIINKTSTDNLFMHNHIIAFDSLQQREYELAKLKKKLELFNIKII